MLFICTSRLVMIPTQIQPTFRLYESQFDAIKKSDPAQDVAVEVFASAK